MMHDKKSSHSHYSEYYNNKTKDLIYRFYKDDIECLSYGFEEKWFKDTPAVK